MLVLTSLQTCQPHQVSKLCQELASTWSPYLYEPSDLSWDTLLEKLEFPEGFPRINYEKVLEIQDNNWEWYVDSYKPELQSFEDSVEGQLTARKDLTAKQIRKLVDQVSETADAHGMENAIWDGIARINSSLAIWVPLCTEEGIAQSGVSGCDETGSEWRQFKRAFKRYFAPSAVRDNAKPDWIKADFWLETYACNASYGGEAGFVLPLSGSDIIEWAKSKSLPKLIRQQGITFCETGVLTFGNGAGHLEAVPLDLSKYTAPKDTRQAGVINNMVDSVFGIVGFSSINYGDGTRWTTNIWFPLKPTPEVQATEESAA
jgi:hypothetical protein